MYDIIIIGTKYNKRGVKVMKLDLDCVRELLLCVEEETGITKNYLIPRGLAFSKPNGFDISDKFHK